MRSCRAQFHCNHKQSFFCSRAHTRYKIVTFHLHRKAQKRCEWKKKNRSGSIIKMELKEFTKQMSRRSVRKKKVAFAQWQINVNFVHNRHDPHHSFVLHHSFPFIVDSKSIHPLFSFFFFFFLSPLTVMMVLLMPRAPLPLLPSTSSVSLVFLPLYFDGSFLLLFIGTRKNRKPKQQTASVPLSVRYFIFILRLFFISCFFFYYFVHFSGWKFNFLPNFDARLFHVSTTHTNIRCRLTQSIPIRFVADFYHSFGFRLEIILFFFSSLFFFISDNIFVLFFCLSRSTFTPRSNSQILLHFSFSISLV